MKFVKPEDSYEELEKLTNNAEEILQNILYPNYWDYLGRFDYPIRAGHRITVRALGAGDRLRAREDGPQLQGSPNLFEFSAAFHRFDFDYRIDRADWRVLISPSIRLDSSKLQQDLLVRRDATVFSGRVQAENRIREWLTLEFGSDVVYERWRRRERVVAETGGDLMDPDQLAGGNKYDGEQLGMGGGGGTAVRQPLDPESTSPPSWTFGENPISRGNGLFSFEHL